MSVPASIQRDARPAVHRLDDQSALADVIELRTSAFIHSDPWEIPGYGRRPRVLPFLNENGDLPPGVHAAGWTEIEQRFGKGSEARVRALATLKHLHELAIHTGSLRNFYVFGSFVSAVPEPRDVDVILIMRGNFRLEDCPWESRAVFSHAAAEARYGATIFWLREGVLPGASMSEFLRVWQGKRDGTLRGILEIA